MFRAHKLFSATALLAALPAQAGSYVSPLGSGCPGSRGVPQLSASAVPEIGRPLQIRLSNGTPSSVCWFFFGGSDTRWGNTPLPMPVGGGCFLRVSADAVLAFPTDAAGSAAFAATLPASPSLIGLRFYNQFAVADTSVAGQLAWTPYGAAVVGAPLPTAPNGLRAAEVRIGSVTLAWNDNSIDELGFRVRISADGQNFSNVIDLPPGRTQYQVSGLTACQPYWFRVVALGAHGNSQSDPIQVTPQPLVPAAPSNLRATEINARNATLAWADNNDTELGFELFVSQDGVHYGLLATPAPDATGIQVTGMAPNTHHWFKIRAVRQCGILSAFSNVIDFTTADVPPAAPSALQATGVRNRQVDLLWTDNSNNEDLFRVRISTDGVTFNHVVDLPPNSRTFTVIELTRQTTYWFKVVARNAAGPSADSNVIRVRTL